MHTFYTTRIYEYDNHIGKYLGQHFFYISTYIDTTCKLKIVWYMNRLPKLLNNNETKIIHFQIEKCII